MSKLGAATPGTQRSANAEAAVWFQRSLRSPVVDFLSTLLHTLITDEFVALVVLMLPWVVNPTIGNSVLFVITFSELINAMLKWYCQEPRPFWEQPDIQSVGGKWEQDYTFPSSHSQVVSSTFFLLLGTAGVSRNVLIAVGSTMVLTGLSRVYRGVHYPRCVATGWILGGMLGYAFAYFDPITWFGTALDRKQQFVVLALCCFIPVSCLAAIRRFVPPPNRHLVEKWQELALKNSGRTTKDQKTLLLEPRRLAKYTFQLAALPGGVIVNMLALYLLENFQSSYLREMCPSVPWSRILVGYAFLIPVGLLVFVVPKSVPFFIRSPTRAELLRIVGCFLIGTLGSGTPLASHYLIGQECEIFAPASMKLRADAHFGGSFQAAADSIVDNIGHTTNGTASFEPCELPHYHRAEMHTRAVPICSVEHLQALVRSAADPATAAHLRVVGTTHSPHSHYHNGFSTWPSIGATPEEYCSVQTTPAHASKKGASKPVFAISLYNHVNKFEIVDSDPKHEGAPTVTAQAGVLLAPAYAMRHSVSYKPGDYLVPAIWDAGYALPNVPGILGLTLGGLISTGSDGDGRKYSLYDSIVAVKILDGQGNLREARRNSDSESEGDLFYASVISMGLLGVVVEYTIKLEPRYCVVDVSPRDIIRNIDIQYAGSVMKTGDYNRIFVSQFTEDKQPGYLIGAMNRYQPKFNVSTCDDSKGYDQYTEIVLPSHYQQIMMFGVYAFYPDKFRQLPQSLLLNSTILREQQRYVATRADDLSIQWCLRSIYDDKRSAEQVQSEGPTREQMNACMGRELKRPEDPLTTKAWHKALAREQELETSASLFIAFSEPVIPLNKHSVAEIAQHLKDFVALRGFRASREIATWELYGEKQLPFWLAPSYQSEVLRIGMFQVGNDNAIEYFSQLWEFLHERNVTVAYHWGKHHPQPPTEESQSCSPLLKVHLAQMPKARDFIALAKQLDPSEVFMTPNYKRLFSCAE